MEKLRNLFTKTFNKEETNLFIIVNEKSSSSTSSEEANVKKMSPKEEPTTKETLIPSIPTLEPVILVSSTPDTTLLSPSSLSSNNLKNTIIRHPFYNFKDRSFSEGSYLSKILSSISSSFTLPVLFSSNISAGTIKRYSIYSLIFFGMVSLSYSTYHGTPLIVNYFSSWFTKGNSSSSGSIPPKITLGQGPLSQGVTNKVSSITFPVNHTLPSTVVGKDSNDIKGLRSWYTIFVRK